MRVETTTLENKICIKKHPKSGFFFWCITNVLRVNFEFKHVDLKLGGEKRGIKGADPV